MDLGAKTAAKFAKTLRAGDEITIGIMNLGGIHQPLVDLGSKKVEGQVETVGVGGACLKGDAVHGMRGG